MRHEARSDVTETPAVALNTSNSTATTTSEAPKSPKTTKPKVKKTSTAEGTPKTTRPKSTAPPTSPDSPSADGKKRVKKRTLDNRPGYGVTAGEGPDASVQAPNSLSQDAASSLSAPASALASDVLITSQSDVVASREHESGSYTPVSLPTGLDDSLSSPQSSANTAQEVSSNATSSQKKSVAPPSQADTLRSLEIEGEDFVADFRRRFKNVCDSIRDSSQAKSATFDQLSELEAQKSQLKTEVKAAEEEEKYERAAELNASIDSSQTLIDELTFKIRTIDADIEAAVATKLGILKNFHSLQLATIAQLSQVDLAQKSVIDHFNRSVSELESEATTVYASKIEMLNERLTDVEAELARSIDREQKIEAKIAANSQGLAEALTEDESTVTILSQEIAELKAQLAAKEAALVVVQTRRDGNQSKMNALRKEQGAYLEDVVQEKQKKEVTAANLRAERTILEAQLARHHSSIDQERALQAIEVEIRNSIAKVIADESRMAAASLTSIDHFESPLLVSDDSVSTSEQFESLQNDVSKARAQLDATKEEISGHSAALKLNRSEQETASSSLPLLEQSKQAAVATRDYKEAARIKAEITTTQAALESLSQNGEALAKQLQDAQSSLLSKQASLTELQEKLEEQEASHASSRMDALKKTKFAARLALRSVSSERPRPDSLLHEAANTVSQAQLLGMVDSIEGEQRYLARKYSLAIPEDTPLPEDIATQEVQVEESSAEDLSQEELVVTEIEAATSVPDEPLACETIEEPEIKAEDEDSGLFDGLDETQGEEGEPEAEVSEYVPPSFTVGTVADDAKKTALKAQIEALEEQVKKSELEEDYESAEDLNNQLLALQSQLASLDL